ncbi:amidohydrolase family protein [Malacoplasma muris]|uniref:amidohydrolase family protein n=1 Tax=Malacoplasma muris TaxID=2119 RepID=UPI00398F04CB
MVTLLKNCLLSNNKKVDIVIDNNIIAQISEEPILVEEVDYRIDQVFDIRKNLVMPGIIDGFARVKTLSSYDLANYTTESIACAHGGITTFIDIPTNPISTNYFNEITSKINEANENSLVNFAFAVNASDISNQKDLMKIQEYVVGTILTLNSRNFKERISDSIGLQKMIEASKMILIHLSGTDIDIFFDICHDKNIRILFYDITNEYDLEKILAYKAEGYNIKTATSIMYLLFNKDHINSEYKRKTITTEYKLGTMLNNIHLWNAIKNGKIDIITSSHMPVTLIEKFESERPGIPNFETLFSILFDNCYFKRIPITILERLLCKNPAKAYGFKNKGEIKVGYDADLVVINTTKRWWIKNEDIVSSARWTPFNDYRISGRVMMTFVNGELVYNFINQMMPIRNVKSAKLVEFDYETIYKNN